MGFFPLIPTPYSPRFGQIGGNLSYLITDEHRKGVTVA